MSLYALMKNPYKQVHKFGVTERDGLGAKVQARRSKHNLEDNLSQQAATKFFFGIRHIL
jgi:hypothetical protein